MKINNIDNLDLFLGILLVIVGMRYGYFYLIVTGVSLLAGKAIRKIKKKNVCVTVWTPFILQIGIVIGHAILIVIFGRISMLLDVILIMAAATLFFKRPTNITAIVNIVLLSVEIMANFKGSKGNNSTINLLDFYSELIAIYITGATTLFLYIAFSHYGLNKQAPNHPNKAL
jgi:hypothetical protein